MRHSLLCASLLLLALRAIADGGFVPTLAGTGASSDQRAILVYDPEAGRETLVLSTRYVGAPQAFAWVVPVPALPARRDVTTLAGGEGLFQSLYETTEPRAWFFAGGGVGCGGCLGGAAVAGDHGGVPAGVNVVDHLAVGELDIALLDAGSDGDLPRWLADNGYALPAGAAPVLDGYVARGWKFLAMKVDAAASAGAGATLSGYLPRDPLKIVFPCAAPVFPLQISSINGAADGSQVLLYVFAPHRLQPDGYPVAEMSYDGVAMDDEAAFQRSYRQQFLARLDMGGTRGFLVEYAQPLTGGAAYAAVLDPGRDWFLTRLRSVLTPGQMTRDLTLAPAPFDDPVELVTYRPAVARHAGQGAAALLLAALLLGGIRLARTSGCPIPGWTGAAVLALLLLGALWG